MSLLTPSARAVVESDHLAHLVTLNPDGSPTGHLWMSDSASGLCRMDANPAPGAQNPPTAAGAPFFENNATCNVFSNKPGQTALDPKPQPDGTHILYVTDANTTGLGLFRLTYDWAGTVCKNQRWLLYITMLGGPYVPIPR